MEWADGFIGEFATPGKLLGHLSYVLLVASMMMRSMKWLRMIAVSAGTVSAFYGYFFLLDYVTVFWEIVFVAVNLVQLLLLELANKRARFSEDEQRFIRIAVPDVEKAHARKLLRLAHWREYEAGTALTKENEAVDKLYFVIEGAVSIERDGEILGVCGHDDFIGEMAFMTTGLATATAIVTNSARCFVFDRDVLKAWLQKDAAVRHALESSFNRNLVDKLVKSNAGRGNAAQIAELLRA